MLLSVSVASWPRLFLIALVYLSSLSECALSFTSVPKIVHLGQTYALGYEASGSDPATILLFKYSTPNVATPLSTLTTTATGGSYAWTVDKSLQSAAEYWLEIVQDQQQSYSSHFQILSAPSSSTLSTNTSSSPSLTSTITASTVVSSTATLIDTSATSLPTTHNQPSSPGLSSGAKIGITVGVVLGILHLIAGAALLWRRRSKKRKEKRAASAGKKTTDSAEKAIDSKDEESSTAIRELDGKNVQPEWRRRTELHDEPAPMAELPG